MDFNTILLRFGLDSSNFVNKPIDIIKTEDGCIYEIKEEYKKRICPFCNHEFMFVHTYKWMTIKLTTTIGLKEELRINRIRYKCPKCHKTHTFELVGLERNKTISNFVVTAIKKEFYEIQSFTTIANRYDVSLQTVINIFDEYTINMPRLPLPKYLCSMKNILKVIQTGNIVSFFQTFLPVK